MKNTVTTQQMEAVELLLSGRFGQQEIADKLGISRITLYRWRTEVPEFIEYYNSRKVVHEKLVHDKFSENLDMVSDTILNIIRSEEEDGNTRLNASKYVIDRVYGTSLSRVDVKNDVTLNDGKVDSKDILSLFENGDKDE